MFVRSGVNDMDKPKPPEPTAHMYPSDLERFAEFDTSAEAYSSAFCTNSVQSVTLVKLSDAISHGDAMAAWGAAQERERLQMPHPGAGLTECDMHDDESY